MVIAHYVHQNNETNFDDELTTIALEPDGWYIVKEIHVYDQCIKVCFYKLEGVSDVQFNSVFFDFYEVEDTAKKIKIEDKIMR